MGFNLRTAVPDDAFASCGLLRRSIEECCAPDHRQQPAILDIWLGNKTPQTIAAWFSSPSNCTLVAERDGELVGLVLLTQAGKLALCYVLPDALRSGIGSALLAAAEQQARAWNISKLHLHSPASASGFFARHGYTSAGQEKSCFGLDCDLMWKLLNADALAPAASQPRKRFCNCSAE
jgi:GNAT superfamily N-acetyltransferase